MRFEYLISEWGKQLSMERKMMRDCRVPRILAPGRGMKASIQEDTHNNLEAQKGGGLSLVDLIIHLSFYINSLLIF